MNGARSLIAAAGTVSAVAARCPLNRSGHRLEGASRSGLVLLHRLKQSRWKRTVGGGGGPTKRGGGGRNNGRASSRSSPAARTRSKAVAARSRKMSDESSSSGSAQLYGLRPVDYSVPPPIYASPPPPPPKPGLRKYVYPGSIVVFLGVTAYFYVSNKNDAYEYWEAMESGKVPASLDVDDDDDDEEDEE